MNITTTSATLQIKKLNDLAVIPTKGSPQSAGYDLYSIEKYTLKPLERKLFKTGLSMAIPSGMYGRIAPRSGSALKNGIDVMAGVIDEDYRNEVGVLLINLSNEDVSIPVIKDGKETAIAQIIFELYNNVKINVVDVLGETERGQGGFGSSDNNKKKAASTISSAAVVNSPKEAHDLIEKWRKSGVLDAPSPPRYETIIKEREKRLK